MIDISGRCVATGTITEGISAIFNYNWEDDVTRSLIHSWGSSTGFTSPGCPHLLLTGSLSLEPFTFGAIKAMGIRNFMRVPI